MVYGWVVNELPKWIVFGTWALINIVLFIYQFYNFSTLPRYFYTRTLVREALAFARGPAIIINFNIIIILLPVCRNLISLLRGTGRCMPRTVKRTLDKNLTFHKAVAWTIIAASAMHTMAHYYNYERIAAAVRPVITVPTEGSRFPLGALPDLPSKVKDPLAACFVTAAGITGHIISVVLFLMMTSSLEFIRRSYFEVFWYTHHLFIVFLTGLAFHQFQQLLPVQKNAEVAYTMNSTAGGAVSVTGGHPPALCSLLPATGCPDATFKGAPPLSWKFMLGGLFIYIVERIVRFIRSLQQVVIIKVVTHPSKTIEIQMKKRGFTTEAGQYVFINVPSVALFEWHPFTLTSSPEEDYFSVHIRIVGDWTQELSRQLGEGRNTFQQAWELPIVAIDGPFGTASEDVFEHEVGMLVGAGIGVTPFASILKSIFYKLTTEKKISLKKVYFYWICPEPQSFEWFADMLSSVEGQLTAKGMSDFLDIHIYLSRGWKDKDAFAVYLREGEERDAVTGLQARTHYGRPDWSKIFDEISVSHSNTDVGVFFCGPPVLSHNLHDKCNEYTGRSDGSGARFLYNKENF
ncbi:hypothetical protein EMCRGX_G034885 [Ephydatia muelleri]